MDYVNFFKSYGSLIVQGIVIILTIISMLIKKKPLTEIYDKSGLKDLIVLVNEAEKLFGAKEGVKKLEYVTSKYASIIGAKRTVSFDAAISTLVDSILDTPERKEKSKCLDAKQ